MKAFPRPTTYKFNGAIDEKGQPGMSLRAWLFGQALSAVDVSQMTVDEIQDAVEKCLAAAELGVTLLEEK